MVELNTTIQKWGNSCAVRLPQSILDAAKIANNDPVVMVADDYGVRIRKRSNANSLDDLFKDYQGEYQYQEIDWGSSQGSEVW